MSEINNETLADSCKVLIDTIDMAYQQICEMMTEVFDSISKYVKNIFRYSKNEVYPVYYKFTRLSKKDLYISKNRYCYIPKQKRNLAYQRRNY